MDEIFEQSNLSNEKIHECNVCSSVILSILYCRFFPPLKTSKKSEGRKERQCVIFGAAGVECRPMRRRRLLLDSFVLRFAFCSLLASEICGKSGERKESVVCSLALAAESRGIRSRPDSNSPHLQLITRRKKHTKKQQKPPNWTTRTPLDTLSR